MCGTGPCTSPTPCGRCERATLRAEPGAAAHGAAPPKHDELPRLPRRLDILDSGELRD